MARELYRSIGRELSKVIITTLDEEFSLKLYLHNIANRLGELNKNVHLQEYLSAVRKPLLNIYIKDE